MYTKRQVSHGFSGLSGDLTDPWRDPVNFGGSKVSNMFAGSDTLLLYHPHCNFPCKISGVTPQAHRIVHLLTEFQERYVIMVNVNIHISFPMALFFRCYSFFFIVSLAEGQVYGNSPQAGPRKRPTPGIMSEGEITRNHPKMAQHFRWIMRILPRWCDFFHDFQWFIPISSELHIMISMAPHKDAILKGDRKIL